MIRKSNRSDIPSIEKLMKSIPGFWNNEWRDDVIERGIAPENSLSFVWEENGKIIGFICVHDLGFRAYLSELIVLKDDQGKNIGKELVKEAEGELQKRGCQLIISDVWNDAVGFYEKLGWSPPDVVLLRKNIKETANKRFELTRDVAQVSCPKHKAESAHP